MEIVILPTVGKQDRIFGEDVSCGLIPATTGERLIYAVIIEFRPEQLLKRL